MNPTKQPKNRKKLQKKSYDPLSDPATRRDILEFFGPHGPVPDGLTREQIKWCRMMLRFRRLLGGELPPALLKNPMTPGHFKTGMEIFMGMIGSRMISRYKIRRAGSLRPGDRFIRLANVNYHCSDRGEVTVYLRTDGDSEDGQCGAVESCHGFKILFPRDEECIVIL